MSRIGRKPIAVPAGVKIQIAPARSKCQGPKGKMSVNLPRGIHLEQKGAELHAVRQSDDQAALHGLARALVANAVHGVTQGFKKDLDIVGVGYRAEFKGKVVNFALGYSHPVEFPDPRRDTDYGGEADAPNGFRRRSRPGRASFRRYSRLASARSVQAKGHSHHRRAPEEESRKGRRGQDGRLRQGETSWQQNRFGNYRVTRIASGFTFACGRVSRGRPSGRGSACIARMDTFTRRSSMTAAGARLFRPVRSTRTRARILKGGSNVAAAKVIGKKIAERTRAAGIEQVVFDRGGYMYHGRVEALAAAAREAGLKF